jgi:hypothetical protein
MNGRTVTFLDSIHCPIFYLKHDVSETGLCLCLQVEPTQLGQSDRASFCLWTPEMTPKGFIKPKQQEPTIRVNIFHTLNLHTRPA